MKNLLVFSIIMCLQPISCIACELLDSVLNELSAYQEQLVRIGLPESRYKNFADLPAVFRYDNTKDTIYFYEAFYDDGYYHMAMWSASDTILYSFQRDGVHRGRLDGLESDKISKWDTVSLTKDRREFPVDMRGIPWVSLTRIIMSDNRGTYETVFYWDIPERWLRKRKEREKRMSQKMSDKIS